MVDSALRSLLGAVATTAGRLDPDEVARLEVAGRLRRQRLTVQEVPAGGARLRAQASLRRVPTTLAYDREAARLERAHFANNAVAAMVAPCAAGAEAQR